MPPKVAIVILNWNGRQFLQRFLPSILSSTYGNYDVVVADNASTDDSVEWTKANYPSVRVIVLLRNYGFARGYNEALKFVQADYYVLLNSDVYVEPGWLEPVIDLMESDKKIGVCQPKVLMYAEPTVFEYAGGAGGWLDRFGYPFARGRVFDYCEVDEGQYDTVAPIFWASGCAMFVRAPLFQEIGGFDNYFFAHQEEIDFCWRLQLAGYSVMACPASKVYHVGGGTLPKGNERKVFLNFRNNLIMLAKNLPRKQLWWKLSLRILLDALSAWKSLFSGEATYFIAVMRAHWGLVKWMVRGKKISVFPANRDGKLVGRYNHSIVWRHFVDHKKTFKEIVGHNE
ncbi:MAG: glycosyltransferase family 2 protein [Chitinophagaceae bacterium]